MLPLLVVLVFAVPVHASGETPFARAQREQLEKWMAEQAPGANAPAAPAPATRPPVQRPAPRATRPAGPPPTLWDTLDARQKTALAVFALVVLAIAALFFFFLAPMNRGGTAGDTPLRAGADRLPSEVEKRERVRELRRRDPSFDPGALVERAFRIFLAVQEAMTAGDLGPVRPLMSDAAFQELRTRLCLAKLFGVRPAVTDVRRVGAWLTALELAGRYDGAHVGIRFEARRTEVPGGASAESALAQARSADPTGGAEVWSFVRRSDVVGGRAGVLEGHCPHCGAPWTAGGEAGRCGQCGVVVNSGAFDWVLGKTSEVDTFWVTGLAAPGLELLQRDDPDCAAQLLEDRALLLFWRHVDALANEEPARVKKVAAPAVVDELAVRLRADEADGVREWIRNVEVEGADLLDVTVAEAPRHDHAHVRVRWRVERSVGPRDGPAPARWVEKTSVVVLARRHGAKTSPARGLSTFRCWSCLAPLTDSDSAACDYCGRDQVDDGDQWRLESVQSLERWSAREDGAWLVHLDELRPFDRRCLVRVAMAMASSDWVVTPDEHRQFDAMSRRLGLAPETVREWLDDPALGPRDFPQGEEVGPFLAALAAMAAADGKVDLAERTLLERVARGLDVPPGDVRELLDRALARREARRRSA